MEEASRTRLVALAVLLAVSVPLVVIAVSGSGGSGEAPAGGLRVERAASGLPEITLYVEDRSLNRSETAEGARRVTVECSDRSGGVLFRRPERWPFIETDRGTVEPHAHVGIDAAALERIFRCRLAGTDPPLEGRVL